MASTLVEGNHIFCYEGLISLESEIVLKKNFLGIAEYMNRVPLIKMGLMPKTKFINYIHVKVTWSPNLQSWLPEVDLVDTK